MLYSEAVRRLEKLRHETIRRRDERLSRSGVTGAARDRLYPVPNYRPGSGLQQTVPSSGAGQPFHFKHTSISRGWSNTASSMYGETTAARHQDYIDRPSAQEREPVSGLPLSFGTIGDGPVDRRNFWRAVEQVERSNGRVQSRLIFVLPSELDGRGRQALVREFCEQAFGSRDLPYWAAFHLPARSSKNASEQNYHCHAVYYDRRARRLDTGEWDFAVTQIYRTSSGNKRVRRPHKQNKHPDTDKRGWIRELRHLFAAVVNKHLVRNGHQPMFDPRSYAEQGIEKTPTRHLSLAAMTLEKKGVDTKAGLANNIAELAFREIQVTSLTDARRKRLRSHREAIAAAPAQTPTDHLTARAATVVLDALDDLCESVFDNRSKLVSTSTANESVTGQVERRREWIVAELEKSIVSRAKRFSVPSFVDLLRDQRSLIDDALIDIEAFTFRAQRSEAFHAHEVTTLEQEFARRSDLLIALRPELASPDQRATTIETPRDHQRREFLAASILRTSASMRPENRRADAQDGSPNIADAVEAEEQSPTTVPRARQDCRGEPLLLPRDMPNDRFREAVEDVLAADAAELCERSKATRRTSGDRRSRSEIAAVAAGLELHRLALTLHDDEDDEVEREFGPAGLRSMTRQQLSVYLEERMRKQFNPLDPSHRPSISIAPKQNEKIIFGRVADRTHGDRREQGTDKAADMPPPTREDTSRRGLTRHRSS